MEIISGKIQGAKKVVIHGPEGIGKSTLASMFPNPIFSDTEGSTKEMDVKRTPKVSSFAMIIQQIKELIVNPQGFKTFVLDTIDWAEHMKSKEICSAAGKKYIGDFGYQAGYIALATEIGNLLNILNDLVESGMNAVIISHSHLRKFEQPEEIGSYDRWELKLEKRNAPLVKEWADMILFINFKTYVINVDNQGAEKGKNKAQGSKRVMYANHHECWDAKNRFGLPEGELPLSYETIRHCIEKDRSQDKKPAATEQPSKPPKEEKVEAQTQDQASDENDIGFPHGQYSDPKTVTNMTDKEVKEMEQLFSTDEGIPKTLTELMESFKVTSEEIRKAVASKGYYPVDTPIKNYDESFMNGVLICAFDQVVKIIEEMRGK